MKFEKLNVSKMHSELTKKTRLIVGNMTISGTSKNSVHRILSDVVGMRKRRSRDKEELMKTITRTVQVK